MNTFNAGSSSQDIDATYYIIRDAVNRYRPKQIYLELSPIMAVHFRPDERRPSNMTGTYIVADYMKPSVSKVCYLLGASSPEYYPESFLLGRRNWKMLFDFKEVEALLSRKRTDAYKNYQYDYLQHEDEWYVGKGYVESSVRIVDEAVTNNGDTSIAACNISDDWFEYLDRIIDCCAAHDVKLTLICAPLSDSLLQTYDTDYQEYHDIIAQVAKAADVDFWDLNLCTKDRLSISEDDYRDSSHLNKYGSEKISELTAQLILGNIKYSDLTY